jgi:Domain of unknown function (DUF4349)
MIDELVLERLLTDAAEEIPVPEDGVERVVAAELDAADREPRWSGERGTGWLTAVAAAAVVVVVVGLVALVGHGGGSSSKSSSAAGTTPTIASEQDGAGAGSGAVYQAPRMREANKNAKHKSVSNGAPGTAAGGNTSSSSGSGTPSGPTDGALIVKTGTLDLQVPHATLHTAVNRVTGVAVGLGGYVADSKSSFDVGDATAQITIRVPVNNFETAVTRLERLPDVKVLGNSENGTDVTAQHTYLQA